MLGMFLFILSCAKQPVPLDVPSARKLFKGKQNCVQELKGLMSKGDCEQLKYAQMNDYDVIFQCHKDDKDRDDFWDTMVFRVGTWSARYTSFEEAKKNERMICIDDHVILEAFYPNELGVLRK